MEKTLLRSSPRRRNNDNLQPKLFSYFTYQTPDSTEISQRQKNEGLGSDEIYGYSDLINCEQWSLYIKDPFNGSVRDELVQFISPLKNTTSKKKQLTPPYGIS